MVQASIATIRETPKYRCEADAYKFDCACLCGLLSLG